MSDHAVIPIESRFSLLKPLDLTRYEAKVRESVLAAKKRKAWEHTPSQYVERLQMSFSSFQKLYALVDCGEQDSRYPSRAFLPSHELTELV
jgi:hypothetical protein